MKKITAAIIFLFLSTNLFSQCYTVDYISYNPVAFTGTPVVSLSDDQYSEIISIGFPFCFYGATYTSLVVGSNGIILFDTTKAYTYCIWPINSLILPNPTSQVKNCILFPWNDLLLSVGGKFRYAVYGTAPNRTFVVTADSVGLFSCTTFFETSQVILYETTNVIEIDVQSKPVCLNWNNGRAILGIQNSLGTLGMTDATVTGTVPIFNIGVRFTPSCNVCTGVGIEEANVEDNIIIFPNPVTNELRIDNSELRIERVELYNMVGEPVSKYQFSTINHQLSIDVSQLLRGIYFITLTDEAGRKLTRKVVKM